VDHLLKVGGVLRQLGYHLFLIAILIDWVTIHLLKLCLGLLDVPQDKEVLILEVLYEMKELCLGDAHTEEVWFFALSTYTTSSRVDILACNEEYVFIARLLPLNRRFLTSTHSSHNFSIVSIGSTFGSRVDLRLLCSASLFWFHKVGQLRIGRGKLHSGVKVDPQWFYLLDEIPRHHILLDKVVRLDPVSLVLANIVLKSFHLVNKCYSPSDGLFWGFVCEVSLVVHILHILGKAVAILLKLNSGFNNLFLLHHEVFVKFDSFFLLGINRHLGVEHTPQVVDDLFHTFPGGAALGWPENVLQDVSWGWREISDRNDISSCYHFGLSARDRYFLGRF